jgi:4-hydroxybenzoate polyprenyltransferase
MDLLRALRPKQWTKNLFVFAALLLTLSFQDAGRNAAALKAFVAMCLLSSATYLANDLMDRERDRNHPSKRNRPIASGRVRPGSALLAAVVCLAVGLGLLYVLNHASLLVGFGYLGLQVLYNFGLKHIAVADVFTLSGGFVLRAVLGATAIGVAVSVWLFLCTGAIALLLGFGKRRNEFHQEGLDPSQTREALSGYTSESLNALLLLAAAATVASYGLYSIESETARAHPLLALSTPFVFYGVCRYLVLVFGKNEGGEPENLVFGDPQLILTLVLFVASILVALLVDAPGFFA